MMVDHLEGVVHMCSVSEVSNVHAQNTLLLNKVIAGWQCIHCEGPGSDNRALS